jgi:hypothetical protein
MVVRYRWNGAICAFGQDYDSEPIISKLITKNQSHRYKNSIKYLIRDSSGAMGMEILHMFVVDLMGGPNRWASRLFLRSTLIM